MNLLAIGSAGVATRAALFAPWRFAASAARACRGITLAQWLAATAVALVYYLLLVTSLLQNVLGSLADLGGMQAWDAQSLMGLALMCLAGAYCFLVGVHLAESTVSMGLASKHRYVIAGVAAVIVALPILVGVAYVLGPPCGCGTGPFRSAIGSGVFFSSDLALTGGLALAAYVKLNSARAARDAFHAAELERLALDREVLASRLSMTRARVEPQFLQSTLSQVETLYDVSPSAAAAMLDSLIVYLRTALLQLREESSTLGREAQLASTYLDVFRARMGNRFQYAFDVPAAFSDEPFPPLILLPLVQDALASGIESNPTGGRIEMRARAKAGHLVVCVMDEGCVREPSEAFAAVAVRLRQTYGEEARVTYEPNGSQGVVATVEVPIAPRHHR